MKARAGVALLWLAGGFTFPRDGKQVQFGPAIDLGTAEVPRVPPDPWILRLPR